MDGASLPVLAAAQSLTTKGAAAVAPAAAADLRDSFAAILGATDLTGLTADQQGALTQLLADPASTLRPLAGAVGKELPEAAIRGLLGALGIALDPQALATKAATPSTGGAAETQPANAPDDGADLAATLLGMLLTAKAPSNAQALGADAPMSALTGEAQAPPANAPADGADLAATLLGMLLTAKAPSNTQALGADAPMSALTGEAQAPPANAPADGADLAATLLAILLQGSAGTDGSALHPEPAAADSGSAESSDALMIEGGLCRSERSLRPRGP